MVAASVVVVAQLHLSETGQEGLYCCSFFKYQW